MTATSYADALSRACAESCTLGGPTDLAGLPAMGFLLIGLLFAASYRYGRLTTRSDDASSEAEALDTDPASTQKPSTVDP